MTQPKEKFEQIVDNSRFIDRFFRDGAWFLFTPLIFPVIAGICYEFSVRKGKDLGEIGEFIYAHFNH